MGAWISDGSDIVIGRRPGVRLSGGGALPWYHNGSALANSLVAYWRMDEASGQRNDSIGTNHLTDNNTVGSAVGHVYPTAADFVAANSERLTIEGNASLDVAGATAWWSGWFRPSLAGSIETIFAKGSLGANLEYALFCRSNGNLEFRISESGGITLRTAIKTASLVANTYHFFIAWLDGTNLNLQLNGGTPSTQSYASQYAGDSIPLAIGSDRTTNYLTGRIGPLMFGKNYAPTADDRAWLYNGAAGRL